MNRSDNNKRRLEYEWKSRGGEVFRPQSKNYGYYVSYNQGEIKYSRTPIQTNTRRNNYGTLMRNDLTDEKLRIPARDRSVVDTRTLIH